MRTTSTASPATADAPVLPLRFTGSGSEYFRIWIVNLLLTVLTLGIYFPWAKLRRLRYFHANTLVDDEPLAFHGNALLMLRGYALMAVFFIGYGVISRVSALGGLFAFVVLALVWPALWRASLQFRMANTSWRGMRFAFTGSLADAYRAMLPAFLPLLVVVGGTVAIQLHVGAASQWLALGVLVAFPWLPALWLGVKRYQHGHYAYGGETTRLDASTGSVYLLALKTFGLVVALALLVAAAGGAWFASPHRAASLSSPLLKLLPLALPFVFYLALIIVIGPFVTARLQNLIWTATSSERISFDSRLRARSLAGLTLKIWLLMPLTLGLYWPFARIALARLRLDAVCAHIAGGAAALAGSGEVRRPGAAGDAAGEFFGIDLGL